MATKQRRRNKSIKRYTEQRKRRGKGRVVALFILPVVFALLITVSLYAALEPFVGHYARAAMMFVGDDVIQPDRVSDLLEQAPPQEEEPVEWVAVGDHSNPEEAEGEPEEENFIRASSIVMPQPGDLFAQITVSGTDVDAPVFWGDSERELNRGVGTFMGGWLPGFGRTVMMAGHRNTDFMDLGRVEIGAVITVVTHYGTYTYEVVETAVFYMRDSTAYDFLLDEENIILYTCYPFDFIGAARYRFFVYGRPLTGTPVARYV